MELFEFYGFGSPSEFVENYSWAIEGAGERPEFYAIGYNARGLRSRRLTAPLHPAMHLSVGESGLSAVRADRERITTSMLILCALISPFI
ncbi:hypothetical protein [Bradyrhizobium sp. BWA-3-5]|uniref:hypothetical protein n=1 Tax=Bradyrhizobium sp. BWA-3-5 TaxID=3080013 RepID=UPI003978A380